MMREITEEDEPMIPFDARARIVTHARGQRECGSERLIKIVLLGDPTAGKTGIFNRVVNDTFAAERHETRSVGFGEFYAHLDFDARVITRVQLIDIPGNDRRYGSVPLYTREVHGAIFVFDCTNRQSFEVLELWKTMLDAGTSSCARILVGTKRDLLDVPLTASSMTLPPAPMLPPRTDRADLSRPALERKAQRLDAQCGFRLVSSKTGDGVFGAFMEVAVAAALEAAREDRARTAYGTVDLRRPHTLALEADKKKVPCCVH